MKYRVISLFSGCGGLDLGFKNAGYKTVFATDVWDIACKTLLMNKAADEVICGDIRDMDFKKYKGKAELVIGGPPCPPYSQTRHYLVNKKGGFEDEKAGFAVPEYFRAIEEIDPKVFVFENVDGFTFKTYEEPMAFLKERSESLGYNITYKVINAANYGVPQTRKRFLCVGVKKELGTFVFPEETHSEKGENGKKKWVTCGEVLYDSDNISEEEKAQRPGSKDYDLLVGIPPGKNYLYYTAHEGYPEPKFKWKSRYWTFLLKLTPDRPSWTIQASLSNNQGPFHWRNRFLRISEIKRIQTIDDDYQLAGDLKEQWRHVGKAVRSQLACVVAGEIKKCL